MTLKFEESESPSVGTGLLESTAGDGTAEAPTTPATQTTRHLPLPAARSRADNSDVYPHTRWKYWCVIIVATVAGILSATALDRWQSGVGQPVAPASSSTVSNPSFEETP